jgi:hypothetical protein
MFEHRIMAKLKDPVDHPLVIVRCRTL